MKSLESTYFWLKKEDLSFPYVIREAVEHMFASVNAGNISAALNFMQQAKDSIQLVDDLEKAYAVSQRLKEAIRDQVPHVERVRIHYEPRLRTHLRYAVPLADAGGTVSEHFGESPYFGLVTVRTSDGQVERQEVLSNPHMDVEKAKGIRVSEWLVALKSDVVLLRQDVHGKGPAYVFADAGVETRMTQADTLAQAISEQTS